MANEYAAVTKEAIPGQALAEYAPTVLAGIARSNFLEQAFAVAAVYELDDGGYANLDIKNTFRRGTGSNLEDMFAKQCPKMERIGGYDACLRVDAARASLHWYLPDRLTVDLSAPKEPLLRKMVEDLPLGDLATLSASK